MSKSIILDMVEKFRFYHFSKLFRNFGKKTYLLGDRLTGDLGSDDKIIPCLRNVEFNKFKPNLQDLKFVAPNAILSGNIFIGNNSSVNYNCILRALGKKGKIQIGNNVVIQDLSSLYAEDGDIIIEDDVMIGANCSIYNCVLKKGTVVGHNSVINKGTKTDPYSFIGAGSICDENTKFKNSQIVVGNPATSLRELTENETDSLKDYHEELIKLSEVHNEINFMSLAEQVDKDDYKNFENTSIHSEMVEQKLYELGFPSNSKEDDLHEVKFYDKFQTNDLYEFENKFIEYNNIEKFPKAYSIYKDNFEKFESSKKFFENKENEVPLDLDSINNK